MIRFCWPKTESDEERYQRLTLLEQEMQLLDQKTPEQVAGDRFEVSYYGRKLAKALAAGEHEAARSLIRTVLQLEPRDALVRLIAAAAYRQLGEPEEEALQLATGLALDGDNYALHHRLARLLLQRGDRETAAAVLEQGWQRRKQHLHRKDLVAERARHFSLLDDVPACEPPA